MVIGVVVLGATFMAVSLQAPPSPQANPSTEQTESNTYSALKALDDHYIDDPRYNNSGLSRALAKAAAGNTTPLVDSIEPFLPPNSNFCVYLNNGDQRQKVYCPEQPDGPTVGVSYPFEPRWRFNYGETGIRYYDSDTPESMMNVIVPLFNSHTVRESGHYVNGTFSGVQTWSPIVTERDAEDPFDAASYTTLMQGEEGTDYSSASVFMDCRRDNGTTEPCFATDLTGNMTDYDPFKTPANDNLVRFTVENRGPGSVSEGAQLELRFPVGLDVNETNITSPGSSFKNISVEGEDPDPETITAELDSALGADSEVHLDVWVDSTDQRYAYKHVDAELSEGATSTSSFLLRVKDEAPEALTDGDQRIPLISGPKPAGSATSSDGTPDGRWGFVLPVPFGNYEIQDFEFSLTSNRGLIDNATFPGDFHPPSGTGEESTTGDPETEGPRSWSPSVSADNTSVIWRTPTNDPLDYEGYTFVEFQLIVETNGEQTLASPKMPRPQPNATIEGYEPPDHAVQLEPGLWWRSEPPESSEGSSDCPGCPGYDSSGDGTKNWSTQLTHRDVLMEGSHTYKTAKIEEKSVITSSIRATELHMGSERVAPGEAIQITFDARDLVKKFGIAEEAVPNQMDLETEIYAPWGVPTNTPVKTFDHGRISTPGHNTPNDLEPIHLTGDSAMDAALASADGNVYGLNVKADEVVPGGTFVLPAAEAVETTEQTDPTLLDQGTSDSGDDMLGVGTAAGIDEFYTIDDDMNERWRATKPDGKVTTYSLDLGHDFTGDGVPELALATEVRNASETTDRNQSRLTIWDGVDQDGDGETEPLDPWEVDTDNDKYGVVTTGKATHLDTAKVGVQGKQGIVFNIGTEVGTNAEVLVNKSSDAFRDGQAEAGLKEPLNVTASLSLAGLLGYNDNAERVFNFTGTKVVDAQTANQITEGSKHSGIAMAGADGYAWGLNASGPIYPVGGYTVLGSEGYTDVSMSNPLDGYIVSAEGSLLATQSGWTDYHYYGEEDTDGLLLPATGARAVDTPDAGYDSNDSAVAWFAGDAGSILRTTDRLDTIDEAGTSGKLMSTIDSTGLAETTLTAPSSIDLADINFNDVLAIDANESWFVGHGAPGTTKDGNGYIVQTVDGGDTLNVAELPCDSTGCGLRGITASGDYMWVVGGNGTMLIRNMTGMAAKTGLDGEADIDQGGRLDIPVQAEETVKIANLTVTWKPTTRLGVGEAATLANATSGDRDLWNKTKGCPAYVEESGNCDADYGYGHGNTLQVEDYVKDYANDEVNRTLNGAGNLTTGPFASIDLDSLVGVGDDPYHGPEWYNNSLNLPLTFHVNVTYTDRTTDVYTVHIDNSGNINTTEASGLNWTLPSELPGDRAFTTPTCLGNTTADCPTLRSVNVTNTGTEDDPQYVGLAAGQKQTGGQGTPMYTMEGGSQTWESFDPPVFDDFYDAEVNPTDPTRWIAVGTDGRVLHTRDSGANWIPLPSSAETTSKLFRGVDHTHPRVPTIVGGIGNGDRFTLNGYVQNGVEETVDIYDESNHDDTQLQKIAPINPPTVHAADGGETPVTIEVWDENKNGGDGGWGTLYTHQNGANVYNLTGPSDDIRLRFTLETSGIHRYSPMIYGNMTLGGYDDNGDNLPEVTFDYDLKDGQFDGEVSQLNYDADDGWLRLHHTENPWIHLLGNSEEGDWTKVRNGSVRAKPAGMDVASNGSTIWYVTEGIYVREGATETETDVFATDPSCSGWNNRCYDNTLYAIDAETGQIEDWWDPMRIDNTPQDVRIDGKRVIVSTGNATEPKNIYWIDITDPDTDNYRSYDHETRVTTFTTLDAFTDENTETADLLIGHQRLQTTKGGLRAYEAPSLAERWRGPPNPEGKFVFSYEVPENALTGSRIVQSNVKWDTPKADVQTTVVQTLRFFDTFDVTPRGEPMPLSPTYNLEVVAWIEDW